MRNLIFNIENKVQEATSAFNKIFEDWKYGKVSDSDLREARLHAKVLVEKVEQFIKNVYKV